VDGDVAQGGGLDDVGLILVEAQVEIDRRSAAEK